MRIEVESELGENYPKPLLLQASGIAYHLWRVHRVATTRARDGLDEDRLVSSLVAIDRVTGFYRLRVLVDLGEVVAAVTESLVSRLLPLSVVAMTADLVRGSEPPRMARVALRAAQVLDVLEVPHTFDQRRGVRH